MTAPAGTATRPAAAAATSGRDTAGTGSLLRFLLRRDRLRLPWWLAGITLLFAIQSTQSQRLYGTAEALAGLREVIGGNAAVLAVSGPAELLETIGGEVVFEIYTYLAILVALMNMFLIGRNTRSDEESGRAELIRSARVGRHATLAAALGLAVLADVTLGLLLALTGVGTGLPVAGSVLFGASLAGLGLAFAAVTAVAVQVFENVRTAYGTVTGLIGAAFALRAAGDVGTAALSWASPIGWGQRGLPYVADRWWPLAIPLAVTVAAGVVAVALFDRRDFGAGLIPSRPGPPAASPALGSAYGLAWRLQRGSVAGWAVGVLALAVTYGSFGDTIERWVAENPRIAEFLPGGAARAVDSYLAVTLVMSALLAAAAGIVVMLRLRAEETAGRAEPLLAAATPRPTWLAGQLSVALTGSLLALVVAGAGEGLAYGLAVSDLGQVPRVTGAALAHLPAVWSLVALAVLAVGLLPRAAAVVSWAVFGYCALVAIFADSFDLPEWTTRASPFGHTPQAPLEAVTATPLIIIGAIAAALLAAGFAGIRRRDIG